MPQRIFFGARIFLWGLTRTRSLFFTMLIMKACTGLTKARFRLRRALSAEKILLRWSFGARLKARKSGFQIRMLPTACLIKRAKKLRSSPRSTRAFLLRCGRFWRRLILILPHGIFRTATRFFGSRDTAAVLPKRICLRSICSKSARCREIKSFRTRLPLRMLRAHLITQATSTALFGTS